MDSRGGLTNPLDGCSLVVAQQHEVAGLDVAVQDFARVAQAAGARWMGTVEQGAFLIALGLGARVDALCRAAPGEAPAIRAAAQRLAAPQAMGTLFKVMGLAAPDWPLGAGF